MYRRGSKPTKDGTLLARRVSEDLAIPVPRHLKGIARKEFQRVVGILYAQERLNRVDPKLIEMYSILSGLSVKSYKAIELEGVIFATAQGRVQSNPAYQQLISVSVRLAALSARLGLHAHDGVGMGEDDIKNPQDEWGGLLDGSDDLDDLAESA